MPGHPRRLTPEQEQRKKLIVDCLADAGIIDPDTVKGHLEGWDLTQPVYLRTFEPGERFVQYVTSSWRDRQGEMRGSQVGNYFGLPGSQEMGELGIGSGLAGRTPHEFVAVRSFTATEGTAAAIKHQTEIESGLSLRGPGGATQVFIADRGLSCLEPAHSFNRQATNGPPLAVHEFSQTQDLPITDPLTLASDQNPTIEPQQQTATKDNTAMQFETDRRTSGGEPLPPFYIGDDGRFHLGMAPRDPATLEAGFQSPHAAFAFASDIERGEKIKAALESTTSAGDPMEAIGAMSEMKAALKADASTGEKEGLFVSFYGRHAYIDRYPALNSNDNLPGSAQGSEVPLSGQEDMDGPVVGGATQVLIAEHGRSCLEPAHSINSQATQATGGPSSAIHESNQTQDLPVTNPPPLANAQNPTNEPQQQTATNHDTTMQFENDRRNLQTHQSNPPDLTQSGMPAGFRDVPEPGDRPPESIIEKVPDIVLSTRAQPKEQMESEVAPTGGIEVQVHQQTNFPMAAGGGDGGGSGGWEELSAPSIGRELREQELANAAATPTGNQGPVIDAELLREQETNSQQSMDGPAIDETLLGNQEATNQEAKGGAVVDAELMRTQEPSSEQTNGGPSIDEALMQSQSTNQQTQEGPAIESSGGHEQSDSFADLNGPAIDRAAEQQAQQQTYVNNL